MTTLVTGATGFIGSAVVRNLLSHNMSVRAFVRHGSDRRNLQGFDVEIVEGDLEDSESFAPALCGCRYLVHTGADYRLWTPDPDAMYRVNVAGTEALMDAAAAAGIEKIVYTSSVATLGLPDDGRPGDETTSADLEEMAGPYKRSKYLAEERIASMVESCGLPVVIVNPSAPVGPGDIKPTPTGQTLLDAARGKMPAFVDTGLNIVHVDDVAQGHYLALTHGQVGRRYVLGGTDMTLQQILTVVAELTGRRAPSVKLPHIVALAAGYASEGIARLTGRPPRVPLEGVRLAKKHMYFSSERAKRELGYQPRPALQAIEDALVWFRKVGYLECSNC